MKLLINKIITFNMIFLLLIMLIAVQGLCYQEPTNLPLDDYYIPNFNGYTIHQIDDFESKRNEALTKAGYADKIIEYAQLLGYGESHAILVLAQKDAELYKAFANNYSSVLDQLYKLKLEYSEHDVYLLAKIMYAEGGGYKHDDLLLMIGNVVLNRVESPLFPNTIQQVIYQTGQYSPTFNSDRWAAIEPNEQCLRLAERLLQGERFCPKDVLYQAGRPQGSGIYWKWEGYGASEYFCYG